MEINFWYYLKLGFEHITDRDGYDHMLFIASIAAMYSLKESKKVLVLISSFTLAHSVALALSVLDIVRVPEAWVEFFIPLSIVLSCVYNLYTQAKAPAKKVEQSNSLLLNSGIIFAFGLVHGLGFSNYLRMMLSKEESILMPLFNFNLGLELGQISFLALLLGLSYPLLKEEWLSFKNWSLLLSFTILYKSLPILYEKYTELIQYLN